MFDLYILMYYNSNLLNNYKTINTYKGNQKNQCQYFNKKIKNFNI